MLLIPIIMRAATALLFMAVARILAAHDWHVLFLRSLLSGIYLSQCLERHMEAKAPPFLRRTWYTWYAWYTNNRTGDPGSEITSSISSHHGGPLIQPTSRSPSTWPTGLADAKQDQPPQMNHTPQRTDCTSHLPFANATRCQRPLLRIHPKRRYRGLDRVLSRTTYEQHSFNHCACSQGFCVDRPPAPIMPTGPPSPSPARSINSRLAAPAFLIAD